MYAGRAQLRERESSDNSEVTNERFSTPSFFGVHGT